MNGPPSTEALTLDMNMIQKYCPIPQFYEFQNNL